MYERFVMQQEKDGYWQCKQMLKKQDEDVNWTSEAQNTVS